MTPTKFQFINFTNVENTHTPPNQGSTGGGLLMPFSVEGKLILFQKLFKLEWDRKITQNKNKNFTKMDQIKKKIKIKKMDLRKNLEWNFRIGFLG